MQILEAFRALNALNEDVFTLDADGINELSDFKNKDDIEDDISIIDPEAETEEDLQDNYIGKVILDCCVCHSKLYKSKEEVTIDESGELANVGEECPYCFTPDGFKVIGEVIAFGGDENTDKEDDDLEELLDFNVPVTATVTANGNSVGAAGGIAGSAGGMTESLNEDADEYGWDPDRLPAKGDKVKVNGSVYADRNLENKFYVNSTGTVLIASVYPGSGMKNKFLVRLDEGRDAWVTEESIQLLEPEVIKRRREYDKVKKDLYGESLSEGIFGFGKKKSGNASAGKSSGGSANSKKNSKFVIVYENESGRREIATRGKALDSMNSAEFHKKQLLKDVGNKGYAEVVSVAEAEKEFGDLTRMVEGVVQESIEDLSMTANDTHIEVTEDESGKVTVSAEPVTADGGETIAPVSDETEAELMGMGDAETDVPADEEVDVELDEFDEESMDELGESYFKRVYEGVKSFKTTGVKTSNNSLIVEGIVRFDNNKSRKTSFIFEAKDTNGNGQVRFVGYNKQLTEGKNAFTMTGKVRGKKLIAESMSYNYRTKNADGKMSRVYGVERTSTRRK